MPTTRPSPPNDTATVAEGGSIDIASSTLLANDSDAENDTLSVTAVAGAVNGTVMLSEDKAKVTYHPRRLGDLLRQLHLHHQRRHCH